MPPHRSTDLEDLLHGTSARDEIQPPVISRPQVLPFNQLSWENFERLCTRLIATEGDVADCHRYGKCGDYQAGIDILAHHRTSDGVQERWCYQCKRWQEMSSGDLRRILDHFKFPADQYRVLVSFEASADLRDVVADLPDVDLLDAEDISRELKGQPELVADYFGPHWRDVFSPIDQPTFQRHLGLNRSQAIISKEIQAAFDAAPSGPIFAPGGLCSGYLLRSMPDRYFVAQAFGPDRDDLRTALTAALAEFGVQPIRVDDLLQPGHILCKTSALIQGTPFGVYQLAASQNRNVYLELGIAIGLGRPFVLIKEKNAKLPPLAQGLDYYPIDSYLELCYGLGRRIRPYLADIASYRPQVLPSVGSEHTALIVHGNIDVIDFCVSVAKTITEYGLKPTILGDPTGKLAHYLELEGIPYQIIGSTGRTQLDETLTTIQAARLGVYRIEEACAPDTFLSLGVSIGLNRPSLLLHRADADPPCDLRGLCASEFTSYKDLMRSFPQLMQAHSIERPVRY